MKWAITDKFRDYLIGSNFVVYTDNNPLAHLQTAKLRATEMRLAQLAQFNFSIQYRAGKSNGNADALSRSPIIKMQPEEEEQLDEVTIQINEKVRSTPVPHGLIITATEMMESIRESQPE